MSDYSNGLVGGGALSGGQGSASEASALNAGCMALSMAHTGIGRIKEGVNTTQMNLASQGYGGADGGKYGQLLMKWQEHADVIMKNLEGFESTLLETMQQKGITQTQSGEAISMAHGQSDQVFDTLAG
ncbi:hypothetical protein ACWCXB_24270 [Streptomyces sp. NPDC001514]